MSGKLIDFHSHIIPNMDDGSRSVEESLQMIRASAEQGVCCIILTPHFYAASDNPQHFLSKRSYMLKRLKEQLPQGGPLLIPGAEIQYFEGITSMQELPLMRIDKTSCLLVEMPFCPWNSRMVDDILELNSSREYTVILAHIERYVREQKDAVIHKLLENGVLMQSNASFFLNRFTSKKAIHMLERGWIHLLGSDCHNMTTRSPNLGDACGVITKKCGDHVMRGITERGFRLLMKQTRTHEASPAGKAAYITE